MLGKDAIEKRLKNIIKGLKTDFNEIIDLRNNAD
jgi:hypothetical protein